MAFFDFLHIFTDLFNSAEKAWHKLEPEVQHALIHGSGVIKIISDNINAAPDEVFTIIQEKYPDITKENLTTGLQQVAGMLINLPAPDLYATIQNLQTYLAQFQGKFWDSVRGVVAQMLAFALAPEKTAAGLISNLMEWVFRKKVQL